METVINFYLEYWIITIPFSIYILYKLIPEILDLALNSKKISKFLEKSDNFNFDRLEEPYKANKKRQGLLNSSNLLELKRQISYSNLSEREKKDNYEYGEIGQIKKAKRLADIFKV